MRLATALLSVALSAPAFAAPPSPATARFLAEEQAQADKAVADECALAEIDRDLAKRFRKRADEVIAEPTTPNDSAHVALVQTVLANWDQAEQQAMEQAARCAAATEHYRAVTRDR